MSGSDGDRPGSGVDTYRHRPVSDLCLFGLVTLPRSAVGGVVFPTGRGSQRRANVSHGRPLQCRRRRPTAQRDRGYSLSSCCRRSTCGQTLNGDRTARTRCARRYSIAVTKPLRQLTTFRARIVIKRIEHDLVSPCRFQSSEGWRDCSKLSAGGRVAAQSPVGRGALRRNMRSVQAVSNLLF